MEASMKTMCAKMGDNIFQGIINMNEAYRERMMKTTTYKAAQQAYDRMEHPDYWADDEDESRLEWDELSSEGRQRRMERNYEMADLRRKERQENRFSSADDMKGE
jgi:hypothetical protein